MEPVVDQAGARDARGRLFVAGRDAEAIARSTGTPAIAYDLAGSRSRRGR
jgi:hypothetical protein